MPWEFSYALITDSFLPLLSCAVLQLQVLGASLVWVTFNSVANKPNKLYWKAHSNLRYPWFTRSRHINTFVGQPLSARSSGPRAESSPAIVNICFLRLALCQPTGREKVMGEGSVGGMRPSWEVGDIVSAHVLLAWMPSFSPWKSVWDRLSPACRPGTVTTLQCRRGSTNFGEQLEMCATGLLIMLGDLSRVKFWVPLTGSCRMLGEFWTWEKFFVQNLFLLPCSPFQ